MTALFTGMVLLPWLTIAWQIAVTSLPLELVPYTALMTLIEPAGAKDCCGDVVAVGGVGARSRVVFSWQPKAMGFPLFSPGEL